MAFLEWRRFNFFELHKQADGGTIAKTLQDTHITQATCGNSHVVLCDKTGWVHLVTRTWNITSFKAYEISVTRAYQFQHDPYLITIGDDETSGNPMLKVWDWSRSDRHGNPICVRSSRVDLPNASPVAATALAVHDNKNLLAVGYNDGSVTLHRGDVTRQRSSKMKVLAESGSSPITGLAFKGTEQLYVVSRAAVYLYCLRGERDRNTLDTVGAAPGCSVLAEKQGLMVARLDAIYCYTGEGRGPCYALEGEKYRIDWFRNYLIITTIEGTSKSSINASTSSNISVSTTKSHQVTILDIQNKFIVFTMTFDEIDAVLWEWGYFYIMTKNKEVMYLDEKDLQSKLFLLFKKNLYDVAIRIAGIQHYDTDGLAGIYKQYGDHLYAKGDLKGAIEQYIKTIGRLETSYVIRKYLESHSLEPLVLYLQELHKKGLATEDHTTLLLTCFVKIDQHDQQGKLKEFINSKDRQIDFDVDIAIKVVRQVSPDDALLLASNNKRHDWYLRIVLEDKKDYKAALEYIADLEFEQADEYMRKYGNVLIHSVPEESTNFLKKLCTDYRPCNKPLVDDAMMSGLSERTTDRSQPDDFVHLFLSNSERLIEFLEHMTESDARCSKLVYNALIEHYIHVWAKSQEGVDKQMYESKVMKVLKNADSNYDKDQTLIICQMLGFKAGILYLYEENKLWRAQVALHMRWGDAEGALGVCRRRGAACPRLWLDVLWWPPPPSHLPELLNVIANERLLSPMLVIDSLASTTSCTLGDVRKYLMNVLKSESDVTNQEQELAEKYRSESDKMMKQIRRIQNEPFTFQGSRCTACNHQLELPTVHFMCTHSYHQHCFQSFSESEGECPACAPAAAAHRAAAAPPRSAETLHARLNQESDPYAVVSEYFGRGLFNKLTVITEGARAPEPGPAPPVRAAPPAAPAPVTQPPLPTYGKGAEASLRLREGQSRDLYIADASGYKAPKGSNVVPVPEGRMRVMEHQLYSSSLEANMKHLPPGPAPAPHRDRVTPVQTHSVRRPNLKPTSLPGSAGVSPKISNFVQNKPASRNPFGDEENYDDAKNPFADDVQNSGNPFDEIGNEDDYDKNLNPFA